MRRLLLVRHCEATGREPCAPLTSPDLFVLELSGSGPGGFERIWREGAS
ncbi:MAG: hypothetical protein ACQGVK_12065 [Myxococcota bacterium]